jgi:hypothetical protein
MLPRILLTARLIAASLPALAADDDVPLPPITPVDGYFVMNRDDATSSSKCIGDPKTPLCAVETAMACEIRGNDDLCRIGMGLEKPGLTFLRLPPEIYWVVRREVLMEQTIPWRSHELDWRPGEASVQAGDIRIDVVEKVCSKGEFSHTACETDPDVPAISTYIVRRRGDRWAVIDWRPPYEDLPRLR